MVARKVFDAELRELHDDLLKMGSLVEKQIDLCINALNNKDDILANKVINDDLVINDLLNKIESKSMRIIAMQQPIASDLRFIFTCINIVTDLERMGDYAVDIAKIAKILKNKSPEDNVVKIDKIVEVVNSMIKESLEAYVERNLEKAYEVSKKDDIVDDLYKKAFDKILTIMIDDRSKVEIATQFLFAFKFLERMADHATNICEWTIYIVTGKQIDLNK